MRSFPECRAFPSFRYGKSLPHFPAIGLPAFGQGGIRLKPVEKQGSRQIAGIREPA